VYSIDESTGGLEISHRLILPTKDYPGCPGPVTGLRYLYIIVYLQLIQHPGRAEDLALTQEPYHWTQNRPKILPPISNVYAEFPLKLKIKHALSNVKFFCRNTLVSPWVMLHILLNILF
jgi:hypothetical protein